MAASDLSSTADLRDEYDFVIVGGGLAGLTLAMRLSENENLHILVLEAGKNKLDDPKVNIPGLAFGMLGDEEYGVSFMKLNGRTVAHPRGKMLGGSGAINFFKYVYPCPSAMDTWAAFVNSSWNYETLVPYVKKCHTYVPEPKEDPEVLRFQKADQQLVGVDGSLQVTYGTDVPGVVVAWLQTVDSSQQEFSQGQVAKGVMGTFMSLSTIDGKTRQRSHAGSVYSVTASSRKNLRVVTEAFVEKLVLEGTEASGGVTATGVEFVSKSGEQMMAKASKEVILCAGSIQSPQLLEVSGIGNAEMLEKHGIKVKIDNPAVGENLQDHPVLGIGFEAADGVQTAEAMHDPQVAQMIMKMYEESRSGPFASSPSSPSAYLSGPELFPSGTRETFLSMLSRATDASASRHHGFSPGAAEREQILLNMLKKPDGTASHANILPGQLNVAHGPDPVQMFVPHTPGNFITLIANLSHPLSHGSVHIRSASMHDAPVLDFAYYSHPFDLEIMARSLQFLIRFSAMAPLSNYLKPSGARIPARGVYGGAEEDDLEAAKKFVRENTFTNYHPCCSCAMAAREKGGVLDEGLKVWGTKNLRVVDASSMTFVSRANPMAVVYAIAERAAESVKEQWL